MEELTEYDRIVEQADQELALNGCVSPFTQRQLDALANGEPIPHIDFGAIVRRSLSGWRDPDEVWFDE
jgi:hypothetical protein